LQQNKTKRRGRQLPSPSAFQKNPEKKATAAKLLTPSSSCYNKTKQKEGDDNKPSPSAMQNKKEEEESLP